MKIYLSFFVLLFSFFGFTQKDNKANGTYSICQNEINKDKCLYQQLQKKILDHYDGKAIELIAQDATKDTIAIFSALAVDFDGNVDLTNSDITSTDEYIDMINIKLLKSLDSFTVKLDNSGNPLSEIVRTKLYFTVNRKTKSLIPLQGIIPPKLWVLL